jgi:hypothetical protein
MANKNKTMYNLKSTISMKKFISEFGREFSPYLIERLMDLELRSVLTRNEFPNILEIKHVEHTKYQCGEGEKELSFGRLIASDEELFFSTADETDKVMEAENISDLFDSMNSDVKIFNSNIEAKKIDDDNIDFFMDKMLNIMPEVSEEYKKILKEMLAYDRR